MSVLLTSCPTLPLKPVYLLAQALSSIAHTLHFSPSETLTLPGERWQGRNVGLPCSGVLSSWQAALPRGKKGLDNVSLGRETKDKSLYFWALENQREAQARGPRDTIRYK